MKYIIRFDDTARFRANLHAYLYHEKCFLRGMGLGIDGVQSLKLCDAEFFDTYQKAEHIVEMVYAELINAPSEHSQFLKIMEITEKEIFKAKLADK